MSDERVMAELADLRRELEALRAQRAHGRRWRLALAGALLAAGAALAQPVITSFTADAPALASEVNTNFTNLRDWSVPRGAILLFEGACPAGYADVSNTRGRVVLGVPANGGAPGTTFGSALGAGDDRVFTHSHSGQTTSFLGYGQGEVNYTVQVGFASPWMIRQNLTTDTSTFRASDVLPSVYLRYCRKT